MLFCLPGRFDIWDIFSNRAAGSVELTALYQPSRDEVPVQEVEAEAATMTATTAAAAATEPEHDREEKELLSKLSELSLQEDTAEMSAGALLSCQSVMPVICDVAHSSCCRSACRGNCKTGTGNDSGLEQQQQRLVPLLKVRG